MQCAAHNEDSAPEALDLKFTPLGTGYLLAEVTRLLRASVDRRMLDLGLTGSMWRVLVYLQREDGRSQADLAKELEVSRASLGQMIDRLEHSGHVQRRAHPDDRRIWRVFLTEKSQEIMPSLGEKAQALHQQTFGRLAKDEHRALVATLMTLRDSLTRN